MQIIIYCFSLLIFGTYQIHLQPNKFIPPPSFRVKQNIDFDWRFIRGDFAAEEETHQVNQLPWQKVNLPHDWTIEGPFDIVNNTTQGFLPMEIGWYKKGLKLPVSWENKKVFIIFDGVYRSSDVWMNYAYLGHHESGYTSFFYDITDYVRFGNRILNGLRVRVDGRRHEQDMYEGNGIYRHVWLLMTDKLHIDYWGTFISTPVVSEKEAVVNIKTKVKNEYLKSKACKLTTKIVNSKGVIVAVVSSIQKLSPESEYEFSQDAKLKNPNLWSLEDPYLYKAYSIIEENNKIVDTYESTFGVRTYFFDSDKGFFLNNKHVKLKGFNAHYDFAGLGTAIPDRIHWNLMKAMKNAGFNFYRSSHNPATPERLDVCDQLGILVWNEIERKLESAEIEHKLVEETIIRDRNHPSIVLWSLENESPLESTVYGAEIMKSATALAHKLDPTRLTTFAASMPVNKKGYGENVDVVSYNYHWKRADTDHLNFPHWKIGLISEYSAARARRGVYGIEKIIDRVDSSLYDLDNGEIQTIYQMCERIENAWGRIKTRDYIGGGCIWSGVDAWGEGNSWPFISRGDGILDLCFLPKDPYYYFVSQWTYEPMLHVFPHWNWKGKEGEIIHVWIYSNCDEVELFLNDRSLGLKKRPQNQISFIPSHSQSEAQVLHPEHLAWDVPYEPGKLRAEGKNSGKTVLVKKMETTSEPYKLRLRYLMNEYVDDFEISPLQADGRDILVIRAEITDRKNRVVPNAQNIVEFSIEGEGKIVGVGNGNISSHENSNSQNRQAYNGSCVVIIQSKLNPGEIVLNARSEDLQSAEVKVNSIAPEPKSIFLYTNHSHYNKVGTTSEVFLEILDSYGTLITSANESVTLNISGEGRFENGEKMTTVSTNKGKLKVNVIPNGKQGTIKLSGYSQNLIPGKTEIYIGN